MYSEIFEIFREITGWDNSTSDLNCLSSIIRKKMNRGFTLHEMPRLSAHFGTFLQAFQ